MGSLDTPSMRWCCRLTFSPDHPALIDDKLAVLGEDIIRQSVTAPRGGGIDQPVEACDDSLYRLRDWL